MSGALPPAGTSGSKPPHALAAARLRMVSSEATDSGRLMRGRQVHGGNAVDRVLATPGLLTGSVQGSDPSPYVVRWHVVPLRADAERRRRQLLRGHPQRSAMLVPEASELSPSCSCIDAASSLGVSACKHAVAVLLAFADTVEHDAAPLAAWRGVELDADNEVDPDDPVLDHRAATEPARAHRAGSPRLEHRRGPYAAPVDPLAEQLAFPPGERLPAGRFAITPLDVPPADSDDVYATVLADALEAMHHASPW